ncbi:MAG: hypothetical protein A2X56_09485 [Nitrospirae bacterium GWC2_57_13]|nr:MAG: hypothetical protein A2X56_09485 [Nitrospirae bacterium GWC2_57_13]
MTNIRQRIEYLFEQLGRLVYRNRVKSLLLMAVFTVIPAAFLPKLSIDTTNESFFRKDDRALVEYNAFKDQFGKDELFVIAVQGPDVFDPGFLAQLKSLHDELKTRVPYLDDITSLINARDTRGKGDTLIVEDLLEHWPRTGRELRALRERALSNPLYRDLLVSEDATFTTIILKAQTYLAAGDVDVFAGFDERAPTAPAERSRLYLSNQQNREMVDAIRDVLKHYDGPGFRVYLAGTPVIVADLEAGINKTLQTMIPLSLLAVFVFLFVMFRRLSGVIYPLLTMILSLLASFGIMAAAGLPMTHITQILPTFLLVVGVGDSVHILAIFYFRYDGGADKEDAIAYALGHSALAVLMTSLTTAAGLLSFIAADVAPIVDMGLIAPVGVMIALLYTVVLLPALLALFPIRRAALRRAGTASAMERLLAGIAKFSCDNPLKIIWIAAVITLLSIAGMTSLRFSHNGLKWLPDDYPIRKATEVIDEHLKGAVALEVMIDTGRENGLHDPDVLNRLEHSVDFASGLSVGELQIGKAWTITAILKEIHQALNENRPEFYAIPQDRKLVAQEFLLFEGSGSDDLEDVVDTTFRTVRFTIKSPFHDAMVYKVLLDIVHDHFVQVIPEATVTTTGVMALFTGMIHNVITTMAKSYLIALSVITVLMIVLIGRVRIGLLSMVPNLIPIMAVMGMMGWLGISLDMSTILVGSIAIGLVVDDTIHFMHNFRRYMEQTGDVRQAVMNTMLTTGRAMLITSVVLASGFFITTAAEMKNTINFGLLTGSSVVLALIADYFLTPALMIVVYGQRKASGSHQTRSAVKS